MKSIRRCMAWLAGAAVVCGILLAAPARAKEPGKQAELPYQVLNVFQRHCLKCHGDDPKGGVSILHRSLLVEQRQVIRPGSPETSELIDLVQGGSMPPGNCPKVPQKDREVLEDWVRSGAAALPSTHEDSYVLWSIVCDLRTLTDEQKRSIRYLSLNHLLARENAIPTIQEQRQKLERALHDLVLKEKQPSLQSIEPTSTVFRIDLRDLGWDRRPYPEAPKRWRRLNLFDLILLEYPHGRLPTHSPFYPDLLPILLALQDAGQVRPIPYLRADWLAEAIAPPASVLHKDFLSVLSKPDNGSIPNGAARPGPLPASEIALARKGEDRWAGNALRRGEIPPAPVTPHVPSDVDKKRNIGSDARVAELVSREAKSGISIKPLDGLEYRPKPPSGVVFKAIDFRDRFQADPPAKDPFAPGDRMALWLKIEWSGDAERIIIDKDGRISKVIFDGRKNEPGHDPQLFKFEAGEARVIIPKDNEGFEMFLDPSVQEDVEYHILYAYPLDDLKKPSFPKGTLLHAEGIHDRFVHPLYELLPNGEIKPPDPSKLVKVVLPVTTRRAKNSRR